MALPEERERAEREQRMVLALEKIAQELAALRQVVEAVGREIRSAATKVR